MLHPVCGSLETTALNFWLCTVNVSQCESECVISSHSESILLSLSLSLLNDQRVFLLIAVLEKEGRGAGSGVAEVQ